MSIAPVDFVKFDPRDEAVAYVCFQKAHMDNNRRAVESFDGKKAMGNTLIVENASSLADRIVTPTSGRDIHSRIGKPHGKGMGKPRERSRVEAKKPKQRKPRAAPPTAEDLDAQLTAYMASDGNGANEAE